jgi:Holliday junction DNA helicase RuvA
VWNPAEICGISKESCGQVCIELHLNLSGGLATYGDESRRNTALTRLEPQKQNFVLDVGRVDSLRRPVNNRLGMIGHLRGQLSDKRPNQVVVDVGGVGYQVSIPLSTFYALGDLRQEIHLLIYTHVREDALALYGFLTAREKQFFELLLSASGVGPTLALKILSGMSVDELLPAIRAGDLVRLTTIPGVGRKTAERIVVELRDKLAAMETPERERAAPAGRTELDSDVISALLNLGYDRRIAEKAVEDTRGHLGTGAAGFEALLRATLQALSRPAQKGARGAAGSGG